MAKQMRSSVIEILSPDRWLDMPRAPNWACKSRSVQHDRTQPTEAGMSGIESAEMRYKSTSSLEVEGVTERLVLLNLTTSKKF